ELHYNIKINTPGTYKLTWRMAVGRGTMVSDHNDTWLKIEADDFYGKKSNHIVKPKPQCESDPNADCPNGATLNGFFKVWGQSTNFIWASFTSDHDAHEIFATFDEPGTYKITLDARSSFCFLDRMVMRLNTVSDNLALSTSTPSSSCTVATNTAKIEAPNKLKIYPNPVQDIFQIENLPKQQGILLIKNIQGMTLRKIDLQSSQATIDTYGLEQGVYYLVYQGKTTLKTQKFLKM
ncbi:MAG: T9SS type A sorting domain-containing protein, partial [Bacteroidota bacterium]